MAKKPVAQSPATKTPNPVAASKPPPASVPSKPPSQISSNPAPPVKPTTSGHAQTSSLSPRSSPQEILIHVWNKYLQDTPSRTMLLDVFMGWLVIVGAVQFLYCILAGNYPFNAFLSGFSAAVGQFVLTASLRMQTSERPPTSAPSSTGAKKSKSTIDGNETGTGKISSERAFADFVFGSLILHGFCVNFIN